MRVHSTIAAEAISGRNMAIVRNMASVDLPIKHNTDSPVSNSSFCTPNTEKKI